MNVQSIISQIESMNFLSISNKDKIQMRRYNLNKKQGEEDELRRSDFY